MVCFPAVVYLHAQYSILETMYTRQNLTVMVKWSLLIMKIEDNGGQ